MFAQAFSYTFITLTVYTISSSFIHITVDLTIHTHSDVFTLCNHLHAFVKFAMVQNYDLENTCISNVIWCKSVLCMNVDVYITRCSVWANYITENLHWVWLGSLVLISMNWLYRFILVSNYVLFNMYQSRSHKNLICKRWNTTNYELLNL